MEIIKSEQDFYTSVEKALDEIDQKWRDYDGTIVCGSHTPSDFESKLKSIRKAREKGTPFLGICFGMQLAAIEYLRNVCDIPLATSEEIDNESPFQVITKLPKLRVGMYSVDSWWATQGESHWHNFSLNTNYSNYFKSDWDISYTDSVAEIMRLKTHPFFVGVQFHPEYQSSKDKPHPLLVQFIDICRK